MHLPGRRLLSTLAAAAGLLAAVASPAPALARTAMMEQPRYAAIVVDANTGEVLYERRADAQRFPASITKVMTAYLTFEALATGRLKMDDRVPFSRWATEQAPSKLGVPAGESLSVRQAILGLTVKSANDAAVALAERVGGSEARFAQLMTLRAQELGMTGTRYVNANGLPDTRQVSTARDIAVLSRAIIRDYPQYYYFFDQADMSWNGHEVLNRHSFLKKIPGVDGIKTGYTNAAGHNLAASAVRGGRRLITVVLGGSSSAARDENVADLMDAGFDVLGARAQGGKLTVAALLHDPDEAAGPLTRPLPEMGSAHDPQVRFVQAPAAARPPVRVLAAAARPVRLAAADPECRHLRGRRLRACRAEARISARSGRVTEVAAVDCGSRRARRRHRAACEAAAPPTVAVRDCAHLHGRRARACRAETATTVAEAAPDCAGRRARRTRACRAEAVARTRTQSVASACAGKRGRHARTCRADAREVAKAERHHRGHGTKLVTASVEPHHGRRRHATVAEAKSRVVKASLKTAKAACRGRHAKRCRAADEDA